jgi:hypothetical protein
MARADCLQLTLKGTLASWSGNRHLCFRKLTGVVEERQMQGDIKFFQDLVCSDGTHAALSIQAVPNQKGFSKKGKAGRTKKPVPGPLRRSQPWGSRRARAGILELTWKGALVSWNGNHEQDLETRTEGETKRLMKDRAGQRGVKHLQHFSRSGGTCANLRL